MKRILRISTIVLAIGVGLLFVPYEYSQLLPEQTLQRTTEIKNSEAEEKNAALMFAGDVMLDRYIRTAGERKGYEFLFEDIKKIALSNDGFVFNLEGPITDFKSVSSGTDAAMPGHFTFTFDPKALPALRRAGLTIAHIGNNHILNFGREGLAQTERYLAGSDITYFGDPDNEEKQTAVVSFDGLTIGLVSFNQFVKPDVKRTVEQIRRIKKQTDFVVVYAHWGDEYRKRSNEKQQTWAHAFIDAGADLVIGSHPHVIQEKELYNGAPIYYSLGNLIFDQYFTPAVRCGLLVRATFTNGKPIQTEEVEVSLVLTGQTIIQDCRP